jgi:hypothetical protein
MLKFAAATIVAAVIVLAADRYAGELFFALGSRMAGHYAYQAFAWTCMIVAVLIATPMPRRWPDAIVCGLVLAVALSLSREITLATVANGASIYVWWGAVLIVFALPFWLQRGRTTG